MMGAFFNVPANQPAHRVVYNRMIRILYIAVSIITLAASCKKAEPPGYIAPVPINPVNPIDTTRLKTYLALGDSYTIGQSVSIQERFPNQAVELLALENIRFSAPEIIAQTGWTTASLINRLNTTPPLKSTYDIVTLLIGVNNQYQRLPQEQYSTEFTLLLNRALVLANNKKSRVIVLSIPDYSVTPFGNNNNQVAKEIDAFNAINKQVALAAGITYIDITGSTRQALSDPSLVAADGLHPSGKEYRKWALLLYPKIKTTLQ